MKKSLINIFFLLSLSILFLAGCSSKDEEKQNSKEPVAENQEKIEDLTEEEDQYIEFGKSEEEIITSFEAEEGIELVEIDSSRDGGTVFVDIYLENPELEGTAELAEKYGKQVKELHPDVSVDLAFAYDNKVVDELTIE